jgi:two-component system, sensor histidine kinase and response regulator
MPGSKPAAVQIGPEVIDRAALEAIRSLQSDAAPRLLAQVVQIYLDSTPALIDQLRTGMDKLDHDAIRAAAHSLKSSSANLGAKTLADLCRTVEMAARAGSIGPEVPGIHMIEREYGAVRRALEVELETMA